MLKYTYMQNHCCVAENVQSLFSDYKPNLSHEKTANNFILWQAKVTAKNTFLASTAFTLNCKIHIVRAKYATYEL